jgi:hypothetical protein
MNKFQEFALYRLEEEAEKQQTLVAEYEEYSLDDYYKDTPYYEDKLAEHRGLLEDLDTELKDRYKKIHEMTESPDLMKLHSVRLLRIELRKVYAGLDELSAECPRKEDYGKRFYDLDLKLNAVLFLLMHDQLAAVSTSPSKE